MSFLPAAIIVGTAVQLYANKKESDAQEAAAEANAHAKRVQANELLDRFFINKDLLTLEAKAFQGSQAAGFIKGGVDVGTGSALLVMEDTNRKLSRQLEIDEKEAEFKARQLKLGADVDLSLGSDLASASRLQRASIFLSGAVSAGRASGRF